ncbi:hypothetical protein Peur_012220 [Populus x canadensis]
MNRKSGLLKEFMTTKNQNFPNEWRRVHFHNVPENLYCERVKLNIDLATNELILSDAPNEAILVKINNKIPGLGLQLDASELNLLYKDNEANSAPTLFYNAEVPDSYEHLLLDFIDGDNHLFMRSDELAAAWNILTPTPQEIDKKRTTPELCELGGRGPIGPYYLYAKYQVRWVGRRPKLVEGFDSDV